jgi:hypothetical protein
MALNIVKQEGGGQVETMMLRGDDGELREYEIVSTRERESVFQRACPVVPVPLAIICCLLNIVPGLYSEFWIFKKSDLVDLTKVLYKSIMQKQLNLKMNK